MTGTSLSPILGRRCTARRVALGFFRRSLLQSVADLCRAENARLALAVSEFGCRTLFANLGKAAGQGDTGVFAIVWSPEE
jgi:hypothetical protein